MGRRVCRCASRHVPTSTVGTDLETNEDYRTLTVPKINIRWFEGTPSERGAQASSSVYMKGLSHRVDVQRWKVFLVSRHEFLERVGVTGSTEMFERIGCGNT